MLFYSPTSNFSVIATMTCYFGESNILIDMILFIMTLLASDELTCHGLSSFESTWHLFKTILGVLSEGLIPVLTHSVLAL